MARRPLTNPRKTASQERSRATVEALLAATARILVREGYERANTNKIAHEAGVSIGSLYQYYPSKEAIVSALLEKHIDEMRALVRTSLVRVANLPLRDATRELVRVMLDAHGLDPKLHRVFAEQLPRIGSLERIADVETETIGLVRMLLEARADEVGVRDFDLAAWVVVTTVEALTHVAILGPSDVAHHPRLVEEITDVVVRYLEPRNS